MKTFYLVYLLLAVILLVQTLAEAKDPEAKKPAPKKLAPKKPAPKKPAPKKPAPKKPPPKKRGSITIRACINDKIHATDSDGGAGESDHWTDGFKGFLVGRGDTYRPMGAFSNANTGEGSIGYRDKVWQFKKPSDTIIFKGLQCYVYKGNY